MPEVTKEQLEAIRTRAEDIRDQAGMLFAEVSELIGQIISPPASTLDIRLNTHKYTPGLPQGFNVYDLQRGAHTPNTIGELSESTEVYVYFGTFRRPPRGNHPGDPEGFTQFLRPAVVGTSFGVCHKADGSLYERVGPNGDADQLCNLNNPDWRAKAILRCIAELRYYNADGAYLDEIDAQPYGYPGIGYPKEFPNKAEWQKAHLSFVTELAQALHAAGKKLWINLGADYVLTDPWVNALCSVVDGVNIEFFVGRDGVGRGPAVVGDMWETQVNFVKTAERAYPNCAVHVRASTSTPAVAEYAFMSWLLGTEFKGSFGQSTNYGNTQGWAISSDLIVQARKLGAPVAPFLLGTEGAVRDFEGGRVQVNPYDVTRGGLATKTGRITLK